MSESYEAWRAIDGAGDHPTNENWGKTDALEVRLTDADADAYGGLAGGDRPNPRAISNVVSRQAEDTATDAGFSDMLWSWGQFVDHDLDLTGEGEEAAPIAVPQGDPEFDPFGTGEATIGFHRSNHTDIGGERAYGNEITSFWTPPWSMVPAMISIPPSVATAAKCCSMMMVFYPKTAPANIWVVTFGLARMWA